MLDVRERTLSHRERVRLQERSALARLLTCSDGVNVRALFRRFLSMRKTLNNEQVFAYPFLTHSLLTIKGDFIERV
jgi:hypothetical protein